MQYERVWKLRIIGRGRSLENEDGRGRISKYKSPEEDRTTTSAINSKRIQKIRDAINKITRMSTFDEERIEQLKAAIYAVCNTELSVVDASNKFAISDHTLRPYIQRMRPLLKESLEEEDTPSTSAPSSSLKNVIVTAKSFDPIERIQTIRDYIYTITERCEGVMREQLRSALY
ncbi:hypothetical protein PENTCL1PPCAC_23582, partial [Pristionchus entomophagus]